MSDEESSVDRSSESGRQTKVERLIATYDLDDVADKLERYWTGDGVERRSLRDLAELFNRRVLRSAMVAAGLDPFDGEAANTYRLLTADDVSRGERTDVKRRLEREGIDVDQLRADFVSHQAIHTYLRRVRGAALDEDDDEPVETAIGVIQRLTARSQAVSASTVEGLVDKGEVTLGDHTITAQVQVTCQDCNAQYDLVQFLRRGRCECPQQ